MSPKSPLVLPDLAKKHRILTKNHASHSLGGQDRKHPGDGGLLIKARGVVGIVDRPTQTGCLGAAVRRRRYPNGSRESGGKRRVPIQAPIPLAWESNLFHLQMAPHLLYTSSLFPRTTLGRLTHSTASHHSRPATLNKAKPSRMRYWGVFKKPRSPSGKLCSKALTRTAVRSWPSIHCRARHLRQE